MGQTSFQRRIILAARFPGWMLCMLPLLVPAAAPDNPLFHELKDNYASLQNARGAYEQAIVEGRLGGQESADYRSWIQQLNHRVQQNCLELARTDPRPLPAHPPCDQILSERAMPVDLDLSAERTQAEKSGLLVEQMNQSMGEFDERLLREQDRIREQRPRTDSEMSSSGTVGGSGAGDQGTGQEGSATATGTGEEQPQTTQGQQTAGASRDEQGSKGEVKMETGSVQQGAPGQPKTGTAATIPDDIPDGSDDDIVARQLREAAEKETDPELREKLWDEYRRYKAGTTR